MKKKAAALLVAFSIVFAIPMGTYAQDGGGAGGGAVNNVLPTSSLSGNVEGGASRVGATDVLSGTVSEVNGEQDLELLTVGLLLPSGAQQNFTLDVSGVDWAATTTEPVDFTGDWKVWNAGGIRDSVVSFKLRYTYTTIGLHTFSANATDGVGFGPVSLDFLVDVVNSITIAPDPVAPDGSSVPGARWGGWLALPGDENVTASNYLKVTNSGDKDLQEFTVDFTESVFAGATDDSWSIDIDDNIEYACAETQNDEAPSQLVFTFAQVSTTGSGTCTFSAGSALGAGVMYVQYRIADVPAPMMGQDYAASYTVAHAL